MTTTEKQTYNGWTNRETWLVGVHDFFDDEEIIDRIKTFRFPSDYAYTKYEVIANDPKLGGLERALTLRLADWLKQSHEDTLYEVFNVDRLNPYLMDHLNGSIDLINWLEIAGHYDEEIKEALSANH